MKTKKGSDSLPYLYVHSTQSKKVNKGTIIGLGGVCFVVIFVAGLLISEGSSLWPNQNEISREIEEIQSELDYIDTLPRTNESVETIISPLLEEMAERPSVINTCTKILNKLTEGIFEMSAISDFNSDGITTNEELEWAVENIPKIAELYEHEDVMSFCIVLESLYPENFPDVTGDEEIRQKIIDLQN